LNKFVGDIRNAPPNKLFLLGSGCSIATEAVGEISHLWQIIDMSYASQSPLLSSRSQFPRFFRTVPSSIGVVDIITNFMKYYNWTQLNIINQLEPEFEQVTDELVRQAGLNVSVVNFHTYDNTDNVVIPKENNIGRIYFLNMYSSKARRILCHNYNSPLSYPLQYPYYVWLVHGWYQDKWWTNDVSGFDPDVNCTDSQFELMLNQSISLLNYPKPSEADMTPTDVNMTVREFYQDYRSRLSSTSLTESYAAPFAYDALWAMAFAINNSLPHIENISLFDNLREQSYPITSAIATNLTNLSPFSGISGNVSFDVNGTREQTQPRVGQYRFALNNDEFILIGNIVQLSSNDSRFVFINGQSNDTVWPIITPFDGTLQVQIETIFLPLSICIYIPGVAAIIFAIICALVNFIFRKRKVIRLTSPNLNYIIILGCILLEVSALLYSFPTTCGTVVHVMCIVS
jgi:gamma-aminobutyric acid type B receptor